MRYICFVMGLLLAGALLLVSCTKERGPVKLGFVAGLTGRGAGLGQEGRDAFLLAVEQCNASGGIDGRPVETVVVNHLSTPEGVRNAMRTLKEAGVVGVVGPMMSQVAFTMVPEAEKLGIPLITPTVSTDALSDRRDLFFRPHYSDRQAALKLAELVMAENIQRITILQDVDNRAYVESWNRAFSGAFSGEVATLEFSSSSAPSFSALTADLKTDKNGGVLILANAPDTGLICQQLAKHNVKLAQYATCWSASGPLFQYGGKSIEGLEFLHSVNVASQQPAYLEFKKAFLQRFGRKPIFPAVHAFDATRIMLTSLEQQQDESLGEILLRLGTFEGLQYPITFSGTGDMVDPPLFLTKVKDAEFCFICNL